MIIFINEEEKHTENMFLSEVLQEFDLAHEWIASAVNGNVVLAKERPQYRLRENDKIEVLAPMQGG